MICINEAGPYRIHFHTTPEHKYLKITFYVDGMGQKWHRYSVAVWC